jgi:electron transport complex protein RnfG
MSPSRATALAAVTLATCALLALLLLGVIEGLTREPIAAARAKAQRDALQIVLPAGGYDNDLVHDRIEVRAPRWLGSDSVLQVWRARQQGAPFALVLQAVAKDGYSGPISLQAGVDARGRVTGVRVLAHRETPGLGDAIEAQRSNWIEGFRGRSLESPPPERWQVRRDGGDFDQFAGATITPRAVVGALRRLLEYVQRHSDALYAAPAGSLVEHTDGPGADHE